MELSTNTFLNRTKKYINNNTAVIYFLVFLLTAFTKCVLGDLPNIFVIEQPIICGVIVVWWLTIEQRIINARIKVYFRTVAGVLFILVFAQSLRYDVVRDMPAFRRYLWYSYYLATVSIPLLSYLVAWNVGKTDYDKREKFHFVLVGIAAILFALVMTNDLHELVFVFDRNYPLADEVYSYGPVYIIIYVWFFVMLIASIILIIIRCNIPGIGRKVWRLGVIIFGGTSLQILTLLDLIPKLPFSTQRPFLFPEVLVFSTIILFEEMMNIGLIQSNLQYKRFFENSTLMAQIENKAGELVYSSKRASKVETRVANDYKANQDYKLQSIPITGGTVYWVDDVSEINKINKEISEVTEQLAEGNELKLAENKILEDDAKYQAINKLFDELYIETSSEAEKIRILLDEAQDEEDFKRRLARACIYNVYVKRQSNLVILGESNNEISVKELYLSIREMLEYVQLLGVKTLIDGRSNQMVPAEWVLKAFRFVEEIVGFMLPDAKALMVTIELKNTEDNKEALILRFMIDHATRLPVQREGVSVSVNGDSSIITFVQDKIKQNPVQFHDRRIGPSDRRRDSGHVVRPDTDRRSQKEDEV